MAKRFGEPVVAWAKLPPTFVQKPTFANPGGTRPDWPVRPANRPHRKAAIAFYNRFALCVYNK